jgi:regulator of protease activity HflC (stomatin/prohibitin superfamily)
MATDWRITNVTPQAGGKTTEAHVELLEDNVVVTRFSVAYATPEQFKAEILRKTAKYQSNEALQKAEKQAEAEKALAELKEAAARS